MKEGDVRVIKKTAVSRECENCGERATKKLSYLLENFRSNPASRAYGRDDCSWCSDLDIFCCDSEECKRELHRGRPDGYYSGYSTWSRGERFEHMFLEWKEEDITEAAHKTEDMRG